MATAPPLLLLGGLGDPGVGLGIDLIYYWGWIALGYSHRPGVIPF